MTYNEMKQLVKTLKDTIAAQKQTIESLQAQLASTWANSKVYDPKPWIPNPLPNTTPWSVPFSNPTIICETVPPPPPFVWNTSNNPAIGIGG